MDEFSDLETELKHKINKGQELLKAISAVSKVNGITKLQKQILQELKFLTKVLKNRTVKKEYLLCTNLNHFDALVSCLLSSNDCVSVLQCFQLSASTGDKKRICVDVVAQRGQQWIKVVARNPKALSQLSAGDGEFGQRTVVDQAFDYLLCASQHPFYFKPPQVTFTFACGIEEPLAKQLQSMGINLCGNVISEDRKHTVRVVTTETLPSGVNANSSPISVENKVSGSSYCSKRYAGTIIIHLDVLYMRPLPCRLNLDVTTMIAYVSALTNGGCHFVFKDPLLTEQASWERKRPVKPCLDQLFKDSTLYCCETAARDFLAIVNTMGGPGERMRTAQLMSRVTVVPDVNTPEIQLRVGGKVKARSVSVFCTGHAMTAVTVTANHGFVRAAANQGMEFATWVHESRALTEMKQSDAQQVTITD